MKMTFPLTGNAERSESSESQRGLLIPAHPQAPAPFGTRLLARTGQQFNKAVRSFLEHERNRHIVTEFRSKLKKAEELIGKLAFSLQEIQGHRLRRKPTSADVLSFSAPQSDLSDLSDQT